MSDPAPALHLISTLNIDQAIEFFGASGYDGRELDLPVGSPVLIKMPGYPGPQEHLSGRREDIRVLFHQVSRRAEDLDRLAENGAELVVRCALNRQYVSAGAYLYEGEPFARWDWDGEGFVVNASSDFWERVETSELRRQLHLAGLPFVARSIGGFGENPLPFSIQSYAKTPAGHEVWGASVPGGFRFFCDCNVLGFELAVGSGVQREHWSPAMLDPAGLLNLFEEGVAAVESGRQLSMSRSWVVDLLERIGGVLRAMEIGPPGLSSVFRQEVWAGGIDLAQLLRG